MGLVADVGGTHARFGLLDAEGSVGSIESLTAADYPGFDAAVRAYLERASPGRPPTVAAVAVAGPVGRDVVELTNRAWSLSVSATRQALGLERLVLLNDFEALALALPLLADEDLDTVHEGRREAGRPMAVLGPGTGLGVAGAVPFGERWVELSTEGGHRDLAATTEREWQVVNNLRQRFGRASVERAISGPGIVWICEALAAIEGAGEASCVGDSEPRTPRVVVDAARRGEPLAAEAVALFCGWLGAVAGDLALTLGARGGVFLGGGVLEKMGECFDRRLFVDRFLDKGRFREYLEPIPVQLIVHRAAALLGAAQALQFPDSYHHHLPEGPAQ